MAAKQRIAWIVMGAAVAIAGNDNISGLIASALAGVATVLGIVIAEGEPTPAARER